ncbi:hypothetical protein LCGC14_1754640 [marine sediment metagenome]|uniref:Uncharacterized protein n=1 Tax=marine sediment metagenome TaxID=412755 RepID=A0A0F9K2F6_9ZZZZ
MIDPIIRDLYLIFLKPKREFLRCTRDKNDVMIRIYYNGDQEDEYILSPDGTAYRKITWPAGLMTVRT